MYTAWAVEQLRTFERLTAMSNAGTAAGFLTRFTGRRRIAASDREIRALARVVEQILDRVVPDWRTLPPHSRNRSRDRSRDHLGDRFRYGSRGRWAQHCEAIPGAITALQREADLRDKLGEHAPALSAAALQPWVWDGARAQWANGRYTQAVVDAMDAVVAKTCDKVGRHDLGGTELFQQLFSTKAPEPGMPRLRLMQDDTSRTYAPAYTPTYLAVHRGAAALAEGLFALLRDPTAHDFRTQLDRTHEGEQQVALEHLAAVSTLARTVQQAQLVTAAGL